MKIKTLSNKKRVITLQLLGWGVILGITLFWSVGSSSEVKDIFGVYMLILNLIPLLLIYLLNYTIFIPKFLFNESRGVFFFANIVLIALLLLASYYANKYGLVDNLRPDNLPPRPERSLIFLARDLISYILMIGLVTALRLSARLERSEEALREAKSARVKAELDNLRSQINPHFLLNTLNNIYALTAIDTEKAQKTIKELSHLLRYILYDNLSEKVLLVKEVEFIKNYIELMSIRLPRKVELTTDFAVSEDCTTEIAPLIFISLIENAFKHSVSSNGDGYIYIRFEDNTAAGEVSLSIQNSNHAKAEEDKSGHGVGLGQVRRRLELLYPNKYEWEINTSDETYSTTLTLKCL
ncbi:MAG: histidine kinase [Bacteroidales bacterium]